MDLHFQTPKKRIKIQEYPALKKKKITVLFLVEMNTPHTNQELHNMIMSISF